MTTQEILTSFTSPTVLGIRPGDRVTILTPHNSRLTGRVVFAFASHAVLNLGGRHGTPGIADESNTVCVKRGGRVIYGRATKGE